VQVKLLRGSQQEGASRMWSKEVPTRGCDFDFSFIASMCLSASAVQSSKQCDALRETASSLSCIFSSLAFTSHTRAARRYTCRHSVMPDTQQGPHHRLCPLLWRCCSSHHCSSRLCARYSICRRACFSRRSTCHPLGGRPGSAAGHELVGPSRRDG